MSATPSLVEPWATDLARPAELAAALREGRALGPVLRRQLTLAAAGAALFGVALGSYGLNPWQVLFSAIKTPLLLLGATALCFPTFFVLQLLRAPSPTSLAGAATLQGAALAATGAVWGAFSLPLAFLVITTADYHLTQFLSLAIGAAGGLAGAHRLRRLYRTTCEEEGETAHRPRLSFLLPYVLLYGAVGAQLAWLLRPFIGSPELGFQLFRPLEGNMLSHVFHLFFG